MLCPFLHKLFLNHEQQSDCEVAVYIDEFTIALVKVYVWYSTEKSGE